MTTATLKALVPGDVIRGAYSKDVYTVAKPYASGAPHVAVVKGSDPKALSIPVMTVLRSFDLVVRGHVPQIP